MSDNEKLKDQLLNHRKFIQELADCCSDDCTYLNYELLEKHLISFHKARKFINENPIDE